MWVWPNPKQSPLDRGAGAATVGLALAERIARPSREIFTLDTFEDFIKPSWNGAGCVGRFTLRGCRDQWPDTKLNRERDIPSQQLKEDQPK